MTSCPEFLPIADLAPGDRAGPRPAWRDLKLHIVETPGDPWFDVGFRLLETEFAARGELELREVLLRRLAWDPRRPVRDCSLLYRMMLLLHANECVALRDHTAILYASMPEVVVHLSHSLVVPAWRRNGLSAILRALPLQTARECAAAAGQPDATVTLVAEMEPWDRMKAERVVRLSAYEKAGFFKVDPHLGYQQPDFRSFVGIDASGGPRLLPLELLVRRIGREGEDVMSAREVQHVVRCLYEMYAVECRAADMRPCFERLNRIGAGGTESYALLRPTENGFSPSN